MAALNRVGFGGFLFLVMARLAGLALRFWNILLFAKKR